MVAHAAPATPQPRPRTNHASRVMFRKQPERFDSMAYLGLPCARMILLTVILMHTKGMPISVILAYWSA